LIEDALSVDASVLEGASVSQDHLGLFDTPPNRRQIRLGLVAIGVMLAAVMLVVPVRDSPVREIDSFIPAVDGIMLFGELITATLLYAQASVFRSRALVVLASSYVFGALLLIPHALTFPGAFAPNGLLGASVNSTAWIYTIRRVAFPIAIILYVYLRDADASLLRENERPPAKVLAGLLLAFALAAAVTMLTTVGQDFLPPYFLNRSDLIYTYAVVDQSAVFGLYVVATAVLLQKRRSLLDICLLVAFSGWLIESLLVLTLHSRFTAGWYCLFALMLFSHLVVVVALIAESNWLYVRLTLTLAARQRDRDARLMSMDAVAGAISHEVGQPLTAMVTSATAALYLLDREQIDVDKLRASLRSTLDAGKRGFDVMRGIRDMFSKAPAAPAEIDLNDLVRETASLLDRELSGGKVSLELALDDALPTVLVDRVQMQQVLVNLLVNALEAMTATRGKARRIAVRSAALDDRDVLLEVSDTGEGIAAEHMPHIFDAFYTTKATGTGLGLSLCRSIVERQGGRLWASPGETRGAVFHLRLPRAA
jgi:signal transduction histidine kinase